MSGHPAQRPANAGRAGRYVRQQVDQLQSVRDRGTWEDWLVFFLRGIVEVSNQATLTARRILPLRESHRQAITQRFGRTPGNGHRVLEHLYEHPIVSVTDVRILIGTTYQAASQLVAKFLENAILEEITGQARNRRFLYRSYTDLFREDAGEAEV